MKTFWKKMFWWDAPAKGAFFALTLLLVGAYVLGSAFVFACEIGWLNYCYSGLPTPGRRLIYFLVPFAVLLLYYLFETLYFFFRSGKGWMRYLGIIGLPLWIGLGVAWMRQDLYDVPDAFVWLWPMLFFSVILPFASCGKNWLWAALGVPLWGLGVFLIWDASTAFSVIQSLFWTPDRLGAEPSPVAITLVQQWGVSGYGWAAWFALVCLLFAGWYLLTAKLFAQMGNCRFRTMFGRPVLTLWAVKILVYLTFSGMVIYEKGQLSHDLAKLEQRFGRPMTAKALGEFYFGGDRPDAEFWRRAQRLREEDWKTESASGTSLYYAVISYPDAELSDAGLHRFRGYLENSNSTATRREQLFSGAIPPPSSEFKEGMLYAIDCSYLSDIRSFNNRHPWRIRFALADGRTDDAVAACRCIARVNHFLCRETFLVAWLAWIGGENRYLDGVEMLLESGQLTDGQLREISTELAPIEPEISQTRERVLYGEAVSMIDWCDSIATGQLFDDLCKGFKPVPLRTLRYYFPQFWWLCLREKAEIARQFNIPDFSHISSNSSGQSILWAMYLPALSSIGKWPKGLAARVRGMRALIAAELWKREHGEYPETLPALPEDPHTGKPLLYRKGESRIQVECFSYNPETENWDYRAEERTVPAIQVWSPAAGDDGPKNKTRAVMKLPGSK